MGRAIFVSHQWLSPHHPDPDGQQLKVLQDALSNLLEDRSRISNSILSELWYGQAGTPSAAELRSTPLFLWYDFFSCPQRSANEQLSAINSIPSYVARCLYFIILCPALTHASRSEMLSFSTWSQRGWCRAERMARELAPTSGFVIVVDSAVHQTLLPGAQSLAYSPGEGLFTVREDSQKVASIVVQLIWNKLHFCLKKGDLRTYRFILNQQVTRLRHLNIDPVDLAIPGFSPRHDPLVDPEAFGLARFLHQNGFKSVKQVDEAGWSPLCYAVLQGNSAVVSELLRCRADPNDYTRRSTPEAQFPKKVAALSLSAFFKSNDVMLVLLEARAAINATDGRRQTALYWACFSNNAEGVRILVNARADAGVLGITGTSAFQAACASDGLEAIDEMLVQLPAQSLEYSLHFACALGSGSGRLVQTLAQARADINERLNMKQRRYFLVWILCKVASLAYGVGASTRWKEMAFHHHGATPLMSLGRFQVLFFFGMEGGECMHSFDRVRFSVIGGAFEATQALLALGARRDLKNFRGKLLGRSLWRFCMFFPGIPQCQSREQEAFSSLKNCRWCFSEFHFRNEEKQVASIKKTNDTGSSIGFM